MRRWRGGVAGLEQPGRSKASRGLRRQWGRRRSLGRGRGRTWRADWTTGQWQAEGREAVRFDR